MGLAVESLGGPRLRTCAHSTGWVREGLYTSSVGRGRSEVSFEWMECPRGNVLGGS